MKKVFSVLLLAAVVFSGCNSSTGNDEDNDNNIGNGGTSKISGAVKLNDVDGAGIAGVTISLTLNNANISTVSTDSNGAFSLVNLADSTYVVTPSKSGYTFEPPHVSVTVSGVDVVVQTFVGTSTGGNNGDSGNASVYLPLKLGATWTFDSTENYDGNIETSTYVESIVGSQVYNGKTYWMREDNYPEWADTTLVRIDGNIAYSFFGGGEQFFKRAKTVSRMNSAVFVTGVEVPIMKFGLSAGQSWTIYDSGATQYGSFVMTGKYIGTETVQVTAGTFQNCLKYEITVTSSYTVESETYTNTDVSLQWFAPNVGMVKSTDSNQSEYYSYTGTDTLKSYNIPN